MESGLVGILAGVFWCSDAMLEGEGMTGVGSVWMGTEVVGSVEAMIGKFGCCGGWKILSKGVEGMAGLIREREEGGRGWREGEDKEMTKELPTKAGTGQG